MAKNTTTAEGESAPAAVTVKALKHISEDGVTYAPGDTFQVSAERLAALPEGLVEVAG